MEFERAGGNQELPRNKELSFLQQAGASPVIQQHQCGRETSLAECSSIWQANPRIYTEICDALLTLSTIGPLDQLGWGCSRSAFSKAA